MILYFIRHAEPIYEPDSLTKLGHIQAEKLSKKLVNWGIDKIYSSTSNRAILTAKPTANLLKKEVNLVDFANEKYAWEGLTYDDEFGRHWMFQSTKYKEIFHSLEVVNLGEKWYTHPLLNEPKIEQEINRVRHHTNEFLAMLGYEKIQPGKYRVNKVENEVVALFAHQGFGLAFLSALLDIPYPLFCTHFDLSLSSVTAIEFKEENGFSYPKILTMSNDSHLNK